MNILSKHENNFDLIRLFACLQVMVLHSFNFYEVGINSLFSRFIWLFPGVIIFFSLSGFLIARSLENHSDIVFWTKRVFRIYPALVINVLTQITQ